MTELKCPKSAKWLLGMLRVLPEGSRGKLEMFSKCPEIAKALAQEEKQESATSSEVK